MSRTRWKYLGLILLAGTALILLVSAGKQQLGLDSGNLGSILLGVFAWTALWTLISAPRSRVEDAISPGEWRAWIGVAFMAAIVVYFLRHAPMLADGPLHLDAQTRALGRNVLLLLLAWLVLGTLLDGRWRGRVLADERDRQIEARAASWGRAALVVCVIGVVVTLGLSPPERLAWATPVAVAHLLIFSLLWGCLVEYAVTAGSYWWDRRP